MKKNILIMGVVLTMVLAACSPAQPAVDVAESEVMEEVAEPAMEEASVEEAAPAADSEEAAAASEDSMGSATEVSFSADVWPIIEQYALNAHGGKGGIFLENYDDIVKQVVPGDPESSMLYKVLIADGAPQMPPSGPLPDELIQMIYDWIDQGAKNN